MHPRPRRRMRRREGGACATLTCPAHCPTQPFPILPPRPAERQLVREPSAGEPLAATYPQGRIGPVKDRSAGKARARQLTP